MWDLLCGSQTCLCWGDHQYWSRALQKSLAKWQSGPFTLWESGSLTKACNSPVRSSAVWEQQTTFSHTIFLYFISSLSYRHCSNKHGFCSSLCWSDGLLFCGTGKNVVKEHTEHSVVCFWGFFFVSPSRSRQFFLLTSPCNGKCFWRVHEVTSRQQSRISKALREEESRDKEGPSVTERDLVKLTQGSSGCL